MPRLVLMLALLLGSAVQVMACPGCAYERMLLSNWLPKLLALKVTVAVLVTAWRLDPLRVSYTFLGYIFVYALLYRYAVWFSFPGGHPLIVGTATAGLFALSLGAFDVGVLFLLSKLNFYRRKPELGLAWWHSAAYLLCIWILWPVIS